MIIGDGEVNERFMSGWQHLLQTLRCAACQGHCRLAGWQVDDAHMLPVHAAPRNAGAQRLGAGFLGSKPLGIGFSRQFAPLGQCNFNIREAAIFETITEPLNRPRNALDIAEIISHSDDHKFRLSGEPAAAGFHSGHVFQLIWQFVRGVIREIDLRERHQFASDIRLAIRAINDAGTADNLARQLRKRDDCFPEGKARRDNVFGDQDPLPFGDGEPPPKLKLAFNALSKNGAAAKLARKLVSRNDTANSGTGDNIDLAELLPDQFCERLTKARGEFRLRED